MFEFKLPDLGEGIHEGELIRWHVREKESIREDDPLCDMETDKATVTIPSPRTGTVLKLNGKPGDIIHVNQVLVVIEENPSEKFSDTGILEQEPDKRVAAAPATRRLAREMGIDITTITGTGPAGRVTPEDIRLSAGETQEAPDPTTSDPDLIIAKQGPDFSGIPFLEIADLPDYAAAGPVEKIPMRSLRKKVAVKTTTSMILVPHVAHMDEWDVTELDSLRQKLNSSKNEDDRITLLSFIVKAVASRLKHYPEFNAGVDHRKKEIVHKKYYHIGIAADTPKGLIVPVIEDADKKSVAQIAKQIRSLAAKGRDGTITAAELTGSTFSITNVGAIGGTGVFPIINYPESAILGMGRVSSKPLVKGDAVVIGKILPVTLCFDHRVADGAGAARFMRDLKEAMEDPMIFLTQI